MSLSARRAWIEISSPAPCCTGRAVALRKESVDRNNATFYKKGTCHMSLSARRAWIEIPRTGDGLHWYEVALRKESVDRNFNTLDYAEVKAGRSPQGERG